MNMEIQKGEEQDKEGRKNLSKGVFGDNLFFELGGEANRSAEAQTRADTEPNPGSRYPWINEKEFNVLEGGRA